MSIQLLATTMEELPWALREQVLSYAESVKQALPEIFAQADVPYNSQKADKIIYLAGIRKLQSIVSSNHWILYNATQILSQQQVETIKIGGSDYSRNGEFAVNLRRLSHEIDIAISQSDIKALISMDYADLVKMDI